MQTIEYPDIELNDAVGPLLMQAHPGPCGDGWNGYAPLPY